MFGNIFESFNWTLKECWEVYFDGGIQSSTLHKSKESVRGDFELFYQQRRVLKMVKPVLQIMSAAVQ